MISLDQLPAELLSRIARHLFSLHENRFEDDGLCNLRLSCRLIEFKTRYLFEKTAFATIIVSLRAHSLSRLEVISNHDRFGKLIKKLVFVKADNSKFDENTNSERQYPTHEYAGYGVIELPKHGYDGVYPNGSFTLRKRVQLGLQGNLEVAMAHASNLKDVVIEPGFLSSFWLDSPTRQEQLNEQAQRSHQSVAESIGEGALRPDIIDLENEDYDNDDIDDPDRIEAYVYSDYLLYLILRAAQQNGIRLSSLGSTDNLSSAIRARTFVEVAPALQGLEHLNISFSASNPTKLRRMDGTALYDIEGGRHVFQSLGSALNSLRGLKRLRFAFDDFYWEEDRHAKISMSLRGLSDHRFEHLTSVGIEDSSFEDQDLFQFIKQQKSTIRQLLLAYVTLPSIEHWRPILTLMLEETLLLTEAQCTQLYGGPSFFDSTLEHGQSCCDIKGFDRQHVLDGLKDVLACFPNHTTRASFFPESNPPHMYM